MSVVAVVKKEEDLGASTSSQDDGRPSVTVKHNKFADPTLKNPSQALNRAVTQAQSSEQQQPHPVETVAEEDVSELFTDMLQNIKMGPPVRKFSPRPCRMFGKQKYFQTKV